MKILKGALGILVPALLAASVSHGQTRTATQPKFRIEIEAGAEGGPRFTVTNVSGKTLTACHIEFFISSQARSPSGMSWDPIVQAGDPSHPRPLEPGASMTLHLPHAVGGPLPDKAEIVAGVWSDGETFGETEWVKQLLDGRISLASDYEQAISLLRQGLEQDWTRAQYLAALNNKPNSGPFCAIRSTIGANRNLDGDSRSLQHAMQNLSAYFAKQLTLLREAKPTESASTSR